MAAASCIYKIVCKIYHISVRKEETRNMEGGKRYGRFSKAKSDRGDNVSNFKLKNNKNKKN